MLSGGSSRSESIRFDSFRFRTFVSGSVRFGLVRTNIHRFGSVWFGKIVFPFRRGLACVFRMRRGSVRFGSVRFGFRFRPVPKLHGSVRFGSAGSAGSAGSVRFLIPDPDGGSLNAGPGGRARRFVFVPRNLDGFMTVH